MDRHKAVRHLMNSARVDQSHLLQQTVCYHKLKNWAFSIAWGYSAYIYEQFIPRSILRRPFETFTPWSFIGEPPHYMFNTRLVTNSPCETPHVFFFHSITRLTNGIRNNIINSSTYEIVVTYVRFRPRQLEPCSNSSADYISKIRVYSPATKLNFVGNRGECCDVLNVEGENTAEVRIRACKKTEMIVV
ncbi:uncharacterized protein LOC143533182 [Bidens hawaiensis]|uniref:uncharacterized protein LOC143533182 n=1 Tax=Bidens hawaiensis TaxID=980011 RepID=UPI00404AA38C